MCARPHEAAGGAGELGDASKVSRPEPVLPIAALLACDVEALRRAQALLEARIGAVWSRSPSYRWSYSDYYEREMGRVLFRQFLGFDALVSPESLVSLKWEAREIERALARVSDDEVRRRVNVDPGYVDAGKVALASGKSAPHRLYLGEGVFGEVTLLFESGSFRALRTTYRDYAEPRALSFFKQLRGRYLEKLRQWRACGCPWPIVSRGGGS